MTHPITDPPDRAFWLDELVVLAFVDIDKLPDDLEILNPYLRKQFRGPKTRAVLEQTLSRFGLTPAVAKNLLLVSKFLSGKRSDAVKEVARRYLGASVFDDHLYVTGDCQRHALTTLLYSEEPKYLLEVDQWHRSEDYRRGVFLQDHPHRKLPRDWSGIQWDRVVAEAQPSASSKRIKKGPPPALHHVVHSADDKRVLLGFVRTRGLMGVRDDAGRLVAGPRDAWTFLFVQDEGRRIDVGGDDDDYGANLVVPLGQVLWASDDVQYRIAHKTVTERDLQRMLDKMIDPKDDDLPLLKVTAEFPEDWHRSVLTIGNSGQTRVEAPLSWLHAAHSRFARNWHDVKSTQIGFRGRHRIQIHFPPPGGERIVTFSQVGRRQTSNESFRADWERLLDFPIYPKSKLDRYGIETPQKRESSRKKLTEADWDRLLSPVVARPEKWAEKALRELADSGVVEVERRAWFLCGSPSLPRGAAPADTLDCDGEVSFDWPSVDPEDHTRLEDDREVYCNGAGHHVWYPLRQRIPLQRRFAVTVDRAGAWRWLLAVFKDLDITETEPGVGEGWDRDPDARVILMVDGTPPKRLHPSMADQFNPCWVLLPGDNPPDGCDGRCVPFSRVLVHGARSILKVWRANRASGRKRSARHRAEEQRSAPVAPPPGESTRPDLSPAAGSDEPPVIDGRATPVRVALEHGRILVNGQSLFHKASRGAALCLALLWRAAEKDREDFERKYPGAKPALSARDRGKLAHLAASAGIVDAGVSVGQVSTWLSRLLKQLDERATVIGCRPEDVVERIDGGYRLAEGVSCHGFDVVKLLQARG